MQFPLIDLSPKQSASSAFSEPKHEGRVSKVDMRRLKISLDWKSGPCELQPFNFLTSG